MVMWECEGKSWGKQFNCIKFGMSLLLLFRFFYNCFERILRFPSSPWRRTCPSGRFWRQRTKSVGIEGRCSTAWYKGQIIFLTLSQKFTRRVLQSHRKESKREGERFFLTKAARHSPSALSHAPLNSKQHTGKRQTPRTTLKELRTTAIWQQ